MCSSCIADFCIELPVQLDQWLRADGANLRYNFFHVTYTLRKSGVLSGEASFLFTGGSVVENKKWSSRGESNPF